MEERINKMIEITNKNQEEVLQELCKQGYIHLIKTIKQDIEINDENYPIDPHEEWSRAKGYGFRMYILKNNEEYDLVLKRHDLFFNFPLENETVIDDGNMFSVRKLFLNGEQGTILYLLG